jgi:hypothetical protein
LIPSASTGASGTHLDLGAIVGGSVAGALVIVLVIAGVLLLIHRNRRVTLVNGGVEGSMLSTSPVSHDGRGSTAYNGSSIDYTVPILYVRDD